MDLLSVKRLVLDDYLYFTGYYYLAVSSFIVSFFFGQFKFFMGYVKRIGQKIGIVRDLKFEVKSGLLRVRKSASATDFPY